MISTLQQIVSALTALFFALQATLVGLPPKIQVAQVAQISRAATLTLSSSPTVTVNDTFTINISLNTKGQNVYGVDINRLRFDPSLLQVVDADSGTAGVQ